MTAPKIDRQSTDELRVFRRFAAAAQLAISPDSIQKREPPEPDIQCELTEHGRTSFELVEIIDAGLARENGNQMTFQDRLREAAAAHQLADLSDALVFVTFTSATTNAQRNAVIPRLMALLQGLPAGCRGAVSLPQDPTLGSVVERLSITRHPDELTSVAFQVAAGAFVSDPVVDRIKGKFQKRYDTANRLELLAYYDLQPAVRAIYQVSNVDAVVRTQLPASQFSRAWVFNVDDNTVLYARDRSGIHIGMEWVDRTMDDVQRDE